MRPFTIDAATFSGDPTEAQTIYIDPVTRLEVPETTEGSVAIQRLTSQEIDLGVMHAMHEVLDAGHPAALCCPECGRAFAFEESLRLHTRRVHEERSPE
jgi:hypothetical protein